MIHTFHSLIEYHETSAVLASIDWAKVASADAWLMFMGRLHPVVVHFPIALLLTAAGVETMTLMGRALRRQNPDTKMDLPGQAVRICLALGVLSGLVACVSGWTLASVEPPPTSLSQTVSIHRWLAVSATIAGAIGLAISSLPGNRSHTLFRPFLLLSGVLVGLTGHFGGALVFGHGHLTAPFMTHSIPATQSPMILTVSEPASAIFEASCRSCHGPSRQRGGLRLDDPLSIGASGTVVPGDPDESELLRRVTLPSSHPDVMPPEGDTPLSPQQIEILRDWIVSVAPETLTPASETGSKSLQSELLIDLTPDQLQDHHLALERLEDLGMVVAPIQEDSVAVSAHLNLLGSSINDEALQELTGLEHSLLKLDLSGTGVTDDSAEFLTSLVALEELSLARTEIGDAMVRALAGAPRLRSLNLFGTRVTDSSLESLIQMESLNVVYVSGSRISDEGIATLRDANTGLRVVGDHD